MPRGVYHVLSKDDLLQRRKELDERIKQFDRRAKALGELKTWLAKRKLDPLDVLWMYRQMKPKRADKPVKSKKPLQPISQRSLKNARKRASGSYMVGEGKTYRGAVNKIKYLSADGQYVWGGLGRKPEWYTDHLKSGGTVEDLMLIKPTSAANGRAQA